MFIVTRKGSQPSVHQDLIEATQAAVKVTEPPSWIWRLQTSRLGTLKRIEVPREEIQNIEIKDTWCIQNRFEADVLEPVDGQLYFTETAGQVQVLEYHRGKQDGNTSPQM